jgi:hypothetical protein
LLDNEVYLHLCQIAFIYFPCADHFDAWQPLETYFHPQTSANIQLALVHILLRFYHDLHFKTYNKLLKKFLCGFGGLVVSMLASGTQDRGSKPG